MDGLDIAAGSETIAGTDLQASITALEALAQSMDADIDAATDVDTLQAIGAAQQRLRDREEELVNAQIRLLAGQVKITADHINAASRFAKDTVATIADWKTKVEKVGYVVDFFSVVLTGDGAKILGAAVKLKKQLS
jgi:hypothetical protein